MKAAFLALFFLALALGAKQLPEVAADAASEVAADAAAPEPVLDITGKKLRTDTDYYILPVIGGRGGGLTMASTGNKRCPPNVVVQDRYEGLPLTFTPANPKKGVVRVSTDLNTKFSAQTRCVQSTVWKVDKYDWSTRQRFVTTGGVVGNPGHETLDNWFKILKYEDGYKLVHCPTVCKYCKVTCRDVGIFIKDGIKRLSLSDLPLKVMFKKA